MFCDFAWVIFKVMSKPLIVAAFVMHLAWQLYVSDETRVLVELGSDIKLGGAPGAFEKEFSEMEEKLNEVRRIVTGVNVSEEGLQEIMEKLSMIR